MKRLKSLPLRLLLRRRFRSGGGVNTHGEVVIRSGSQHTSHSDEGSGFSGRSRTLHLCEIEYFHDGDKRGLRDREWQIMTNQSPR